MPKLLKRIVVTTAAVLAIAAGVYLAWPRAQSSASVDAAIKSSWSDAEPEWQAWMAEQFPMAEVASEVA